jgi:hypothetical protein
VIKTNTAENKLSLVSSDSAMHIETQNTISTEIQNRLTEYFPKQGITVGQLVGFENKRPIVQYSGCLNEMSLKAQSIVALTPDQIGKPVLLAFENENPERPIVVGLIIDPDSEATDKTPVFMEVDGERLLLTAEREIVLRCGDASLTLTRAGKVIIKGAYVLSRSSGYNKIKGAAVDIN